MFSFIDLIHAFDTFLSTSGGDLLKNFVELVLFTLVTYMILTEYTKNKTNQLKYLIIAFASLAIQSFIMTVVNAYAVFGDVALQSLQPFVPVLARTLELLGLVLLANAFIYPMFREKIRLFKSKIKFEIIGLLIIAILLEFLWLIKLSSFPASNFENEFSFFIFQFLKLIVLLYPAYLMTFKFASFGKYTESVIIAFLVYSIAPILLVINFLFYNNQYTNLELISHPFPFISVLLFTRVMYLKLVDKAYLRDKLSLTEKKYREEKEISKMKDDFVSVVSHELRTPLTSIRLYLSLLESEKMGKINREQKNALKIIGDESVRLSNLISDILSLSKLEAKKVKLTTTDYDIYDIVTDKIYFNLAKHKKIKIINNVPKNFIARIDPEKFKQVFINLFSNAIKYSEEGGVVKIFAKKLTKTWELSVEDNGRGIEQDKLKKIFDKFYQIEDYMTGHKGGTGLGLAIVKHLVNLHNGTIRVKSEIGKGSIFTVSIPNNI